jgi:hypothetical protein
MPMPHDPGYGQSLMDLVEIAPLCDHSDVTAQLSARLMFAHSRSARMTSGRGYAVRDGHWV